MFRTAALSLALVWSGASAPGAAAQSAAPEAEEAAAISPAIDEVDPGQPVSQTIVDLAGWILASGDNRELPFAIVDKAAAQILVFGADGKLQGLAPALIGSAVGDESAPGVGDRELKDIPLEERTTPAGRYLAGFGPATGGKTVLWVDYATAVSIHAMENSRASRKEKRKERLASATPEDNRITHGCINVSPQFYTKVIRPAFKDGGVFYVLPDAMSLEAAFPAFREPSSRLAVSREEKKTAVASKSSKRSAKKKKPQD